MKIVEIISEDSIFETACKCFCGHKRKRVVSYFMHNWPDEVGKLSKELRDGTYKERKARIFTITEPKKREIMNIHFRDRVYQRALSNKALYEQTTKAFINDNFACQTEKGTDAARDRFKEFLQRHYRQNGNSGYVLKIDIKGYYPNMNHEFAEEMLKKYLEKDAYDATIKILRGMPGKIGYNPGSQIIQIIGIAALDKIDHFVKEVLRVKYYIRYMDDMILIHKSKEFLLESLEKIKGKLHLQKMQENQKKTKIFDLAKPVKFLGFVYHLTKTGKVYVLADPKKIKHEKKKITRMINLVRTGKLRKYDVDRHFKAYKASVRYGNSHKLLQRLNTWYCAQWEDFENGNH